MDGELEKLEELSYDVAMDYTIQSQLSDIMDAGKQSEYNFKMSQIRSRLNAEVVAAEQVAEMIYTDRKWIKYAIANHYLEVPSPLYEELLNEFSAAKGAYVCRYPTNEFPYMLLGRDIRKHLDASMDYLGSLMFVVDVKGLVDMHVNQLETGISSLCVQYNGTLIYESEEGLFETLPAMPVGKDYDIVKISGKEYFFCQLTSAKTGWSYINVFPHDEIYAKNNAVRFWLLASSFKSNTTMFQNTYTLIPEEWDRRLFHLPDGTVLPGNSKGTGRSGGY